MSCYCTFFDRGYLAQGMALWASLQRHERKSMLWVLALDEEVETVLRAITPLGLRVVSLTALLAADPQLASIQARRPRQEFIFALKPSLCRFLLRENYATGVLTYLDADLYFFGDPSSILNELGDGSVFLAPHRYLPWHDDSAYYGRFNAGVLAFRDDVHGHACLDRWREQCLQSCSLMASDVSYGDQKYLDEWPERYGSAVCVSLNPGVNVAPWNWRRHAFNLSTAEVQVDGAPLVVFHFAQFRRISRWWFDSGQLEYGIMPLRLRSRLYGEYWAALGAAEAEIQRVWPDFSIASRGWSASLGRWHLALLRLFWGQYWLRIGSWWLSGRIGFGQYSGRMMAIYRRYQRRRP